MTFSLIGVGQKGLFAIERDMPAPSTRDCHPRGLVFVLRLGLASWDLRVSLVIVAIVVVGRGRLKGRPMGLSNSFIGQRGLAFGSCYLRFRLDVATVVERGLTALSTWDGGLRGLLFGPRLGFRGHYLRIGLGIAAVIERGLMALLIWDSGLRGLPFRLRLGFRGRYLYIGELNVTIVIERGMMDGLGRRASGPRQRFWG